MRPVADSDATASDRKGSSERKAASERTGAPRTPPAAAPAGDDAASALPPVAKKPMKPIGPAALKALREAIRSGAYPSDAVVRDGIERLIRRGE
ncbi:MAG: hypothetical protein U1E39_07250 [Planctomycetota bacterium]